MELAAGSLSCQLGAVVGARGLSTVRAPLRVGMKSGQRRNQSCEGVGMTVRPSGGTGMVRAGAASEVEVAKGSELGGVVRGVLFDMDGVLCDSEHCSRQAAVELFAEMGYTVTGEDFIPFMGTGTSLPHWNPFCLTLNPLKISAKFEMRIASCYRMSQCTITYLE